MEILSFTKLTKGDGSTGSLEMAVAAPVSLGKGMIHPFPLSSKHFPPPSPAFAAPLWNLALLPKPEGSILKSCVTLPIPLAHLLLLGMTAGVPCPCHLLDSSNPNSS